MILVSSVYSCVSQLLSVHGLKNEVGSCVNYGNYHDCRTPEVAFEDVYKEARYSTI